MVRLCKTCKQCNVKRVLTLSTGIFLDHFAKTNDKPFVPLHDLFHLKGEVGTVIRIFHHALFCFIKLLLCGIFRRNKDMDQITHQHTVFIFMLHRKQIHLMLH